MEFVPKGRLRGAFHDPIAGRVFSRRFGTSDFAGHPTPLSNAGLLSIVPPGHGPQRTICAEKNSFVRHTGFHRKELFDNRVGAEYEFE